jgi:propanol-preferring alcohol dehydrogenase
MPGLWCVSRAHSSGTTYAKDHKKESASHNRDDAKLTLVRDLSAEMTVNAATGDPVREIQRQIGGIHGVVIPAVLTTAFHQGSGMLRRGGTCVLVGLPPGEFSVPIFPVVLGGLTIR